MGAFIVIIIVIFIIIWANSGNKGSSSNSNMTISATTNKPETTYSREAESERIHDMHKPMFAKEEITNSQIAILEARREKIIANGANPNSALISSYDRKITTLKAGIDIPISEQKQRQEQEEERTKILNLQQKQEATNYRIAILEVKREKLIADGANPNSALISSYDRKIATLKAGIDIPISEQKQRQEQEEERTKILNLQQKQEATNYRIAILEIKREKLIADGANLNSALISSYDRKIATLKAGIGINIQIREQKQCQAQIEERTKLLRLRQEQEAKRYQEIAKITEAQREKEILKRHRYKSDWQQYQNILNNNNINTLYHFTDRANLQSIKRHGAVYSWHYCVSNNIDIPMPGGDDLSRSLDRRNNLQNYVRVSFTRNHPMMYIALNQNRINDPIILEIDQEVIFWVNAKYANKNATRNDVSIGSEIDDFRKIRFDIVKLNKYVELDDTDKPYFQAEVLILEKIPIEFIKNIDRV